MVQTEVLVFLWTFSTALSFVCRDCKISTVQRLKTADCYRRELEQVPRCHTSGIEVLELSFNRIRDIKRNDLDSYPNVQILYLADNLLRDIDDEAFADKYYLNTLDLSSNSFYHLPAAIFHLPRLRKLHIANIANPDMVNHIEAARPVTSPIAHLDLSNNKLTRLPDFGDFPTLAYYNVSGNKNVHVNVSVFAGMCTLRTFSNEDFSPVFDDPCDCKYLNEWLERRGVEFKKFTCENVDCHGSIPEEYITAYNKCKKAYEEQQLAIFRQQILTNTGIGAAVILILIIILVMILLRSKKNKKRKMEEQQTKRRKYNDRDYD